jgi:hypothetical protein
MEHMSRLQQQSVPEKNGVLNIPNITGGCECNYTPNSQAYVPTSVIERAR